MLHFGKVCKLSRPRSDLFRGSRTSELRLFRPPWASGNNSAVADSGENVLLGTIEDKLISDYSQKHGTNHFTLEDSPKKNPEKSNGTELLRHFVNVGKYEKGSIFGLGEELQDRIIIAKNEVQCLLLPRYWLFQKEQNLGNIWSRTKMFIDKNVPSRQALFREFLLNRRWRSYRQQVIKETPKRNVHKTTRRNIPIMCRIDHGL